MEKAGDGGEDMELDEEEQTNQINTDHVYAEKSEEMLWRTLDLDQQCQQVMDLLSKQQRRWDSRSEDSNVPILEDYKKTSLTERDVVDTATPTALHILAKNYKKHNYSEVPKDTRKVVIRYLLEHIYKNPFENRSEGAVREDPILKVAMKFGNDDFIDCVMDCWEDKFPHLLGIRDSEEKNFLHEIFAWPSITPASRAANDRNRLTSQQVRAKTLTIGRKVVPKAQPETLAAMDKYGNTPIHYAMDYRQCWGRTDTYVKMFQEMVLKGDRAMRKSGEFNKQHQSPIQYCKYTKKEYMANSQKSQKNQAPSAQQQMAPPKAPAKYQTIAGTKEPKSRTIPDAGKKGAEDDIEKSVDNTHKQPSQAPLASQDGSDKIIPRKVPVSKGEEGSEGHRLRRSSTFGHNGLPTLDVKPTLPPTNGNNPTAQAQAQHQTTPPDKRAHPAGDKSMTKSNAGEKPVKDILEFLRLHYIRTRSDLEARELIDGKDASDENLYFDASGLRRKGADKVTELIGRMSIGGFGDTLAYVYLPTIMHGQDSEAASKPIKKSYPMNQGVAREDNREENPNIGRTSLINVFDRLYEVGVRNILRLHVEDREALSHTDAAIEMALQGRDSLSTNPTSRPISVETWDWRKPDLSTDVIAFAAPTVEQVNLYWSGNQTVLRAWGCPEGIPRLYATTRLRLKLVNIYAAPGLETRNRMDRMLERFIDNVSKQTDKKVEVKLIYQMSGLLTQLDLNEEASDSVGGKMEGEQQHVWVQRMEEFRGTLRSVHEVLNDKGIKKPERVKVALIDDGIDLSSLDSHNGIVEATGRSYYPPDGKSERPWHSSSRGHGTIMANMIVRVNPWISLYVMKLQDGSANDGGRTIFAESAAKAIHGAIQRKVDIISMSWTVKHKNVLMGTSSSATRNEAGSGRTSFEANALGMLEDAIEAAKKAKILMFCSASDDIQANCMESLPYGKAPDFIFRIGAALSLGQRDPTTDDAKRINYFFPGNQVAELWNPRSATTVKYHDGSSVATALAAGLASLIIYCAILVRSWHEATENMEARDRFDRYVKRLKERDNMRKAFDRIRSQGWEDKKYLPVWAVFGVAADNINKAARLDSEKGRKLKELEDLVLSLCD